MDCGQDVEPYIQKAFAAHGGSRSWDDIIVVTETIGNRVVAPQLLCWQAKKELLRHEALDALRPAAR